MRAAVRQVVLNPSLETQVKNILRQTGGSLYVPSPTTCFQDSAGTTPCTVDSPVGLLRDSVGTNHASQATSGFKPILRGKVKNYILQSNGFDSAAWGRGASVSGTPVVTANQAANPVDGSIDADKIAFPAVSNPSNYSVVFQNRSELSGSISAIAGIWIRGNVGGEQLYLSQTKDGVTYQRKALSITTGWQFVELPHTTSASGANYIQLGVDLRDAGQTAKAAQTVYVYNAQYQLGSSITDSVLTTTESASSYYGPYWLDFDGVDDRLRLANIPFQFQDKPFMTISAIAFSDSSANRRYVGVTAGGSSIFRLFNSNATGFLNASVVDDVNTVASFTSSSNISNNTTIITFLSNNNSDRRMLANNNQIAHNSVLLGNSTLVDFYLGGESSYLKGGIYCAMLGKGAISDSALRAIAKYAAKLSGVSI